MSIELTIKDITNAVSIIDVCVKRGAIEGSELTTVGQVRDKLASFVEENTLASEETEETTEETKTPE